MGSKRLFVLKAKTLDLIGTFACLKKFACCGQVPRLSSLHYGFLEVRRAATAKENSAEFPQRDG